MSSAWTVSGTTIAQHGQRITAAMREATAAGARAIIERQVDLLRRGIAPDGSPQKANDEKTSAAKQRKGQGSTPLIASGGLTRASAYQLARKGNATSLSIEIRLPPDRQRLLLPLRALGYRLLELTDADLEVMRIRYSETLQRLATRARGGRR